MAVTRRPPPATPTETPPHALVDPARAALLAWYDARGRTLAFRATRDPYAILVSEVMAQQTQVSRVVTAWRRFLDRFPTVASLADATPADVLREWQGMGYDRRALNLRLAAEAIVDRHDGTVPSSVEALERLPGVGPYTARAVASIAFGIPVGAVDTNVRRVLGRVLTGATPTAPDRRLQASADASVDRARPGDWTHAVMDLGATVCRPRTPRCEVCPLAEWCRFARFASSVAVPDGRGSGDGPVLARERRARPRPAVQPFTETTRWLRGRIVDRLRAAPGAAWTDVDPPIGSHDRVAVRRALRALARDGVIELDPESPERARLALA
jgi:A/G-specific adenine glycosylase